MACLTTPTRLDVFNADAHGRLVWSQLIELPGAVDNRFGVADYNNDGRLDLVVFAPHLGTAIFMGTPRGVFGSPVVKRIGGAGMRPYIMRDCTRDMLADVVLAGHPFQSTYLELQLWRGNGAGGYFDVMGAPLYLRSVEHVFYGRLNPDMWGDMAAIALDHSGRSVLMMFFGWAFPWNFISEDLERPLPQTTLAALGDVNSDGRGDLVGWSPAEQRLWATYWTGYGKLQEISSVPIAGQVEALLVQPVDTDPHDDLLLVERTSTEHWPRLRLRLGKGTGEFAAPAELDETPADASEVVSADFDRDGRTDLVSASALRGELRLARARSDSGFEPARVVASVGSVRGIAAADVDLDTWPDLALIESDGGALTLRVLRGDGQGGFVSLPAVALGVGASAERVETVSADFNSDARADLALAVDGGVSVLLGRGDGTFRPATTYTVGGAPRDLALCDVDHDGRLDLAVGLAGDGALFALLRGDGSEGFGVAALYGVGDPDNLGALTCGAADGDPHPDVVVAGLDAGLATRRLLVFHGDGLGGFSGASAHGISMAGLPSATGVRVTQLALFDRKGDGGQDLALRLDAPDPSGRRSLLGVCSVPGPGAAACALETVLEPLEAGLSAPESGLWLADLDGNGPPEVLSLPARRAAAGASFVGQRVHVFAFVPDSQR